VLLIIFLALCVILITIDFRQGEGGPLDRARDFSSTIVEPIQRGFTAIFRPVGNFFSSIGELGSLRAQNAELLERLELAQEEIDQADSIQDENARLREELALDESWASMDRVAAEVIYKAPSNYKWIVKIDKGRADGIQPDMAVITADGLAGKITRATDDAATVLLLIDPTGAAAAKTEDGRTSGLVSGNGAGEPLSFQFVSADAKVTVGDEVLTSSYNQGIFPPNIPIGRVSFAGAETAALEKDIDVEPFTDFQSLDFVQVLLESGPKLDPEEQDR
jgi:rod shape-determining protein MreC